MSRLGMRMNTHALAICAGCWRSTGLTTTGRALPAPMRQAVRHAATTARSKTKSETGAAGEVAAVPKKKISTKTSTTTATATATKRPRKKAETTISISAEETPQLVKKTTRAASTKTTAASVKKKAETAASTVKATATKAKTSASAASSAAKKSASASTTARKASAAASSSSAKAVPTTPTDTIERGVDAEGRTFENAADPAKWSMRFEDKAATMKPIDRNSPEYKKAGRSWLGLMVGLPFLIVSSYILFERLALGKQPPPRPQPQEASPEKESIA